MRSLIIYAGDVGIRRRIDPEAVHIFWRETQPERLLSKMEKHWPIWEGALEFLEDSDVAKTATTCRILYSFARSELTRRVRHYLISDNSWEHGFYPVQGYYGRGFDGNGNELGPDDGVWWVRCLCDHHEKLFSEKQCSCLFWFPQGLKLDKVLNSYRCIVHRESFGAWVDRRGILRRCAAQSRKDGFPREVPQIYSGQRRKTRGGGSETAGNFELINTFTCKTFYS